MRAFVLGTGRCGTTTFARACAHIDNFTSGHETRSDLLDDRCVYPDGHIEVDNRLAWFCGTLERLYGDDPVYVHLTRDRDATVESYAARFRGKASLVRAFGQGIIQIPRPPATDDERVAVARLCIDTIGDNITALLADKTKVVHVELEDLQAGFDRFWTAVGASGDLDAAHEQLQIRHNRRRRRG